MSGNVFSWCQPRACSSEASGHPDSQRGTISLCHGDQAVVIQTGAGAGAGAGLGQGRLPCPLGVPRGAGGRGRAFLSLLGRCLST